jgi:putative ABC transport system permease protein
VGDRFDNITAIRTREALEAVQRLVAQIGWGARVAAAVTLAAGTLVLAGAVAADRRRRRYEAVLFKVLGASRMRIASIYAIEYGLLGAVTAGVATALGTAAAWAVVTGPMDFEWAPRLDLALATVAAATMLTLAIGFAGTWRALRQKVGPELRNE